VPTALEQRTTKEAVMSQPTGEPQGGPPSWQQPPQPPSPPPAQSWQQSPQQPQPPTPPPSQAPSWTANITSTAPVVGPAGYYYADVPNRIIAYIIDVILLGIINLIVLALVVAIMGASDAASSSSR